MSRVEMKPSARLVLKMLRENRTVTTHQFVLAGAGSRFGARIGELRALGFGIESERLPLPARGDAYRLVFDAERMAERASEVDTRRAIGSAADAAGYVVANAGARPTRTRNEPSPAGSASARGALVSPAPAQLSSLFDADEFAQRPAGAYDEDAAA